ncbi:MULTISPECIES: MGDG synthase family glycosyltransferase [Exiguobacterium]|uniref:MGDG synthase family glycosyltransferase n=2 Tax=Bacillales Family XII. Incertae Sedis TaxID=539742 RepID=UPI00068EBCB2|nr:MULTISPECIES: glycosyltransferase [unclassified Exiguobacterium]
MQKIVIFPFLRMRSGHHLVAEAIAERLQGPDVEVKEVELLSTISPFAEWVTSKFYLNWIRHFSNGYSRFYHRHIAGRSSNARSTGWTSHYFQQQMLRIIRTEEPDVIICTHAFPSYLLNQLKERNLCDVPVINAYTDLFVSRVWGKTHIEYHLLPNREAKQELLTQHAVPEERLFVTGIPVHPAISGGSIIRSTQSRKQILVAGGNGGLGQLETLLKQIEHCAEADFYVLCGNNRSLYKRLSSQKQAHIHPLAYIDSRDEMNQLYERMDAIVTKPGGVTVSEAFEKRVPLFMQHVLPGQEEINRTYLLDKGLAFSFDQTDTLADVIRRTLENPDVMHQWQQAISQYQSEQVIADRRFFEKRIAGCLEGGQRQVNG